MACVLRKLFFALSILIFAIHIPAHTRKELEENFRIVFLENNTIQLPEGARVILSDPPTIQIAHEDESVHFLPVKREGGDDETQSSTASTDAQCLGKIFITVDEELYEVINPQFGASNDPEVLVQGAQNSPPPDGYQPEQWMPFTVTQVPLPELLSHAWMVECERVIYNLSHIYAEHLISMEGEFNHERERYQHNYKAIKKNEKRKYDKKFENMEERFNVREQAVLKRWNEELARFEACFQQKEKHRMQVSELKEENNKLRKDITSHVKKIKEQEEQLEILQTQTEGDIKVLKDRTEQLLKEVQQRERKLVRERVKSEQKSDELNASSDLLQKDIASLRDQKDKLKKELQKAKNNQVKHNSWKTPKNDRKKSRAPLERDSGHHQGISDDATNEQAKIIRRKILQASAHEVKAEGKLPYSDRHLLDILKEFQKVKGSDFFIIKEEFFLYQKQLQKQFLEMLYRNNEHPSCEKISGYFFELYMHFNETITMGCPEAMLIEAFVPDQMELDESFVYFYFKKRLGENWAVFSVYNSMGLEPEVQNMYDFKKLLRNIMYPLIVKDFDKLKESVKPLSVISANLEKKLTDILNDMDVYPDQFTIIGSFHNLLYIDAISIGALKQYLAQEKQPDLEPFELINRLLLIADNFCDRLVNMYNRQEYVPEGSLITSKTLTRFSEYYQKLKLIREPGASALQKKSTALSKAWQGVPEQALAPAPAQIARSLRWQLKLLLGPKKTGNLDPVNRFASLNLSPVATPGDGHCLFHAVLQSINSTMSPAEFIQMLLGYAMNVFSDSDALQSIHSALTQNNEQDEIIDQLLNASELSSPDDQDKWGGYELFKLIAMYLGKSILLIQSAEVMSSDGTIALIFYSNGAFHFLDTNETQQQLPEAEIVIGFHSVDLHNGAGNHWFQLSQATTGHNNEAQEAISALTPIIPYTAFALTAVWAVILHFYNSI